MYYEIFEELRYCEEQKTQASPLQLLNKSLIDSFFDLRSEIAPIYKEEDDFKRLVGKNYAYIYYQKLIAGIAKSVFLGLNVLTWKNTMFLPNGRLRVPADSISFDLKYPVLFFNKEGFSFENSSLKRWEDEVMKAGDFFNPRLQVEITREGFRAHLNRILEILFSMRSSSTKRRTNWTVFLHDLIILQKTYTEKELTDLGFSIEEDGLIVVSDKHFPTHHYLEYKHLEKLAKLDSKSLHLKALKGSAFEQYSQFNSQILGHIPLCHFYINEHMFIGKEEYSLNQYIEYFLHPWTKASNPYISYLENGTGVLKNLPLDEFASELKRMGYSLIVGFHESRDGKDTYYSSEPRMVKG